MSSSTVATILIPAAEFATREIDDSLSSVASQTILSSLEIVLVTSPSQLSITESPFWRQIQSIAAVSKVEIQDRRGYLQQVINSIDSPYCLILDPRDVLVESALEELCRVARLDKCDMVVGDYIDDSSIEDGSRGACIKRTPLNTIQSTLFAVRGRKTSAVLFSTHLLAMPGFSLGLDGLTGESGIVLSLALRTATTTTVPSVVMRTARCSFEHAQCDHMVRIQDWASWVESVQRSAEDLGLSSSVAREVRRGVGRVLTEATKIEDPQERTRAFEVLASHLLPISPAEVAECTTRLSERLAYYCLQQGDHEQFFNPAKISGTILIYVDRIFYAPDGAPTEWVEVFRLGKVTAAVEWASHAPGSEMEPSLTLSGIINVPVVGLRAGGSGLWGALVLSGPDQIVVPVSWRRREEIQTRDNDYSAFTCTVPWPSIPGDYALQIWLCSETGSLMLPLSLTAGALRSSKPRMTKAGLFQVAPGTPAAVLKVSEHRKTYVRAFRRDLVAVARRRGRYWKHRVINYAFRRLVRREVWAVSERGDTAQDTGIAFFKHIREHRPPGVAAYYIMARDARDWSVVRSLGHAVPANSIRHRLLLSVATHLICSQDIDSFMIPESWNADEYRKHFAPYAHQARVFLQHGVVMNGVGPVLRRGSTGLDLFVCSCEPEKDMLQATTRGYTNELQVLGLSRFDRYFHDDSKKRDRVILVAPTWRRYLVADRTAQLPSGSEERTFEGSRYQRELSDLLLSARLRRLLVDSGYRIVFLPHYEVADEWGQMFDDDDVVEVISGGAAPFGDLLQECSLFITDYSSTQFDAALLGTPLIYFSFDAEEFYSAHYSRGWFDQERDGFGPVATTVGEVVEQINHYLSLGFVREDEYTQRLEKLDIEVDGYACERIVSAIRPLRSDVLAPRSGRSSNR